MFYLRNTIMVNRVRKYIEDNRLLPQTGKVIVGLSGGADSVALLTILNKLGYKCLAIHCNFHLRGNESDRDEQFVTEFCKRTGTELRIIHFGTEEYAREKSISIEMAARELRYRAFEDYRASEGADAIAVAHHRNDSAETILLNLVRGTGIKGLHGIRPRNGHIIRPLLCTSRDEILEYLKWRGLEYVTDSSNLTSDYTRNKIRLEIIPKLAEINPSIIDSLSSTAEKIHEAEVIYSKAIQEAISRVRRGDFIDIEALRNETAPATLLFEILSPLGFNSTHVANLAKSLDSEGYREVSNKQWRIIKERDKLIVTPQKEEKNIHVELPTEGNTNTPFGTISMKKKPFDGNIPKDRHVAMLDYDRLRFPLTLRNAVVGDRFAPFGMRGTKLVSDYLTDHKKSIIEKQRQLVVTDRNGDIVWLVGERPSSLFSIRQNTKDVMLFVWEME